MDNQEPKHKESHNDVDNKTMTLQHELDKSDKEYKRLVRTKMRFDAIIEQQMQMIRELCDRFEALERCYCQ